MDPKPVVCERCSKFLIDSDFESKLEYPKKLCQNCKDAFDHHVRHFYDESEKDYNLYYDGTADYKERLVEEFINSSMFGIALRKVEKFEKELRRRRNKEEEIKNTEVRRMNSGLESYRTADYAKNLEPGEVNRMDSRTAKHGGLMGNRPEAVSPKERSFADKIDEIDRRSDEIRYLVLEVISKFEGTQVAADEPCKTETDCLQTSIKDILNSLESTQNRLINFNNSI